MKWLLAAILIVVLSAAVWDFARRSASTFETSVGPKNGVVFTGQFNRVRHGLALFEQGEIDSLLVSGVNAGSGMTPERFADQFALDASTRDALAGGRLTLATQAETTRENVLETRCWLADTPSDVTVVLITSADHMPRASLLLQRALPGRDIQRQSIPSQRPYWRDVPIEFVKYLMALTGLHGAASSAARVC